MNFLKKLFGSGPASAEEKLDRAIDYDRAVAAWTAVIGISPRNAGAFVLRGAAYVEIGEYDRAIADFTASLQLEPQGPVYYNRGLTNDRKGEYDRAVLDFTQALRLDPELLRTIEGKNLASWAACQNDHVLAEFAAVKAAAGYHIRALECQEHDSDLAIRAYSKALELDPKMTAAYYRRGLVHLASKEDRDAAVADFTRAVELEPNFALGYACRGTAYNWLGNSDQASADADQAIRLNPRLSLGYNARGYSCLNRGRWFDSRELLEQAVVDFTEALRVDPTAHDCYQGRAQAYRALGQQSQAADDEMRAGN